MPRPRIPTLTILSLALLSACGGIRVETDWDRNAPFASYETFVWLEPAEGPRANQIIENRIRRAVVEELGEKGLTEDPAAPDLQVTYMAMAEEQVEVAPSTYGYWRGSAIGEVDVYRYTQGTLVLDLVDVAANQLVWRGVGTGVVGENVGDPEQIRHAVERILKDFPPR